MIWLVGKAGMLGTDLGRAFTAAGLAWVGSDREVDFTDPSALEAFGQNKKIDWVVNCAAYTAVDKFFGGKFRRKSEELTLTLEPTPDLLAEVASTRRPNQLMVGFALEPRDELLASAKAKLIRKNVDMVVANPLETMDSDTVEAIVLSTDGREVRTPGTLTKPAFAPWLMDLIDAAFAARPR